MLPNSLSPNRLAACAVSRNWYEVVWKIGTATAPLPASVRGPACRTSVSGFLLCAVMISLSVCSGWRAPGRNRRPGRMRWFGWGRVGRSRSGSVGAAAHDLAADGLHDLGAGQADILELAVAHRLELRHGGELKAAGHVGRPPPGQDVGEVAHQSL